MHGLRRMGGSLGEEEQDLRNLRPGLAAAEPSFEQRCLAAHNRITQLRPRGREGSEVTGGADMRSQLRGLQTEMQMRNAREDERAARVKKESSDQFSQLQLRLHSPQRERPAMERLSHRDDESLHRPPAERRTTFEQRAETLSANIALSAQHHTSAQHHRSSAETAPSTRHNTASANTSPSAQHCADSDGSEDRMVRLQREMMQTKRDLEQLRQQKRRPESQPVQQSSTQQSTSLPLGRSISVQQGAAAVGSYISDSEGDDDNAINGDAIPANTKLTTDQPAACDSEVQRAMNDSAGDDAEAAAESAMTAEDRHVATYLNTGKSIRAIQGTDVAAQLINWSNRKMIGYQVRNLDSDWTNGCAILALLNAARPGMVAMALVDPHKAAINISGGAQLIRQALSVPQTELTDITMAHASGAALQAMVREWLVLVRNCWPLTPEELSAKLAQQEVVARRLLEEEVAAQRRKEAEAARLDAESREQQKVLREQQAQMAALAEQQQLQDELRLQQQAEEERVARSTAEAVERCKEDEMRRREQAERQRAVGRNSSAEAVARRSAAEAASEQRTARAAAEAAARREAEEWAAAHMAEEQRAKQVSVERMAARRREAEAWATEQMNREKEASKATAGTVQLETQQSAAAAGGVHVAVAEANDPWWNNFASGFVDSVEEKVSQEAFTVLRRHALQPTLPGVQDHYVASYEDDAAIWDALAAAKLPPQLYKAMASVPKNLIDNKHGVLIMKHLARKHLQQVTAPNNVSTTSNSKTMF